MLATRQGSDFADEDSGPRREVPCLGGRYSAQAQGPTVAVFALAVLGFAYVLEESNLRGLLSPQTVSRLTVRMLACEKELAEDQ